MYRERGRLGAAVMLCVAWVCGAEEPAPSAKVHDHVAFVFRAPDGNQTAAQRAAEASKNLNAAMDENLPGAVMVDVGGSVASVRIGARQMFRLVPADAAAAGAADLQEYAPRVQAALDSFMTKERRRARLQRGVLRASLVVFFGLLTYLLVRVIRRSTRTWEEKLLKGSGGGMARLGLSSERSRSLLLLLLAAARMLSYATALYVFFLGSLSLFEGAEAWRNQLVGWVTGPLAALGTRLFKGLPNVVVLVLLFAAMRGGWQALSVAFDRAGANLSAGPARRPAAVVPFRLLARAGLVVAALLLVPLVLGYEGDLFTGVGFVLLSGAALSLAPLVANISVGTYLLLRQEYELGEWVVVRGPGGEEVQGEVVSVDFMHVRVVPRDGGEVRLPHLRSLWFPVHHLPSTRPLSMEMKVDTGRLAPDEALRLLQGAADEVLLEQSLSAKAEVLLTEVTPERATFQVRVGVVSEAARSALLLALSRAVRRPGPAPRSSLP